MSKNSNHAPNGATPPPRVTAKVRALLQDSYKNLRRYVKDATSVLHKSYENEPWVPDLIEKMDLYLFHLQNALDTSVRQPINDATWAALNDTQVFTELHEKCIPQGDTVAFAKGFAKNTLQSLARRLTISIEEEKRRLERYHPGDPWAKEIARHIDNAHTVLETTAKTQHLSEAQVDTAWAAIDALQDPHHLHSKTTPSPSEITFAGECSKRITDDVTGYLKERGISIPSGIKASPGRLEGFARHEIVMIVAQPAASSGNFMAELKELAKKQHTPANHVERKNNDHNNTKRTR